MRFTVLLMFLLLLPFSRIEADEISELMNRYRSIVSSEMNAEEKQKAFTRLAEQLEAAYPKTDELYPVLDYNIGTLYLKADRPGPAIYWLKRAMLHSDDPRISANLLRAGHIGGVDVKPPEAQSASDYLSRIWAGIPARFFQVFLVFFSVLTVVLLRLTKSRSKALHAVALLFCLCLGTLTTLRSLNYGIRQTAVLLENTLPRKGYLPGDPPAFNAEMPAGSSGTLLRKTPGFVEISFPGGRGWVREDKVGAIKP